MRLTCLSIYFLQGLFERLVSFRVRSAYDSEIKDRLELTDVYLSKNGLCRKISFFLISSMIQTPSRILSPGAEPPAEEGGKAGDTHPLLNRRGFLQSLKRVIRSSIDHVTGAAK